VRTARRGLGLPGGGAALRPSTGTHSSALKGRPDEARQKLTGNGQRYPHGVLRAVLFDVDFTLSRPGPELGPDGFWRTGERYGLDLDRDRYDEAHADALARVQRPPDHAHDEETWICFAERVLIGMGGDPARTRQPAAELVDGWGRHENFDLYDDALPVLQGLRYHGLAIGLVSNGHRDVDEFARHHGLDVDVAVGSKTHGVMKPHPSIFSAALEALSVSFDEAVMVGDSLSDDVEGARAVGMRGILLDRLGRYPSDDDVIADLLALPPALGLRTPDTM
jgi:HAD superfamily hydrolase (TIGR01662 family)